jgi:hypothetical protein
VKKKSVAMDIIIFLRRVEDTAFRFRGMKRFFAYGEYLWMYESFWSLMLVRCESDRSDTSHTV